MDWLIVTLAVIVTITVVRLASRLIRMIRNRRTPPVRALRTVGAHHPRTGAGRDDAPRFADLFHWMWHEVVESDEGLPPATMIAQLASSADRSRQPLAVAAAWSVAALVPATELQRAATAMRPEGVAIAASAFESAFPGAIRARVLGRRVGFPARCAALAATLLIELGIRDRLFEPEDAFPST